MLDNVLSRLEHGVGHTLSLGGESRIGPDFWMSTCDCGLLAELNNMLEMRQGIAFFSCSIKMHRNIFQANSGCNEQQATCSKGISVRP